jgi:hypothetical protein
MTDPTSMLKLQALINDPVALVKVLSLYDQHTKGTKGTGSQFEESFSEDDEPDIIVHNDLVEVKADYAPVGGPYKPRKLTSAPLLYRFTGNLLSLPDDALARLRGLSDDKSSKEEADSWVPKGKAKKVITVGDAAPIICTPIAVVSKPKARARATDDRPVSVTFPKFC